MSRRLAVFFAVMFPFMESARAQEPSLRPGSIDVTTDGSFDPPGVLVRLRPIISGTREPLSALIEVRAMKIQSVEGRQTPTPIGTEASSGMRVPKQFGAENKSADIVFPYARILLPRGLHRVVFEVRVSLGDRLQFTQLSSPVSFSIGDSRQLKEVKRRPVMMMKMVERSHAASIDGKKVVVTEKESQSVSETVEEPTGRVSEIPGGFMQVQEHALEDRSLVTVSNKRIVHYATNRRLKSNVATPRGPVDFADTSDATLRYGTAEVTIPLNHKRGDDVVEPGWFTGRDKAFQFTAFNQLQKAQFLPLLGGDNSEHDLLILVHGYNTTFQFALFKTVQLAHDIDFKGKLLTFSWASKGSLFSFRDDLDESKRGRDSFLQLLREIKEARAGSTGTGRVHVIAHSMGSRVVCGAIGDVGINDDAIPRIANVVLCAGEIDFDSYDSNFSKVIARCDRHSSYYHSRDRALAAAKEYHHTQAQPRDPSYKPIGEHPYLRSPPPCTDNIECNAADLGLMASLHGYYSTAIPVLEDLGMLIGQGKGPQDRGLISRRLANVEIWALQP